MFDFNRIIKAIVVGDGEKTTELSAEALQSGVDPRDIISSGLQAGMAIVGEKFSSGEFFLPDMLIAARAMKTALEVLKPSLGKSDIPGIGRILIGTVEGDMHDIGKNVVATFLSGNGFEVHDLGINVPVQKFVDEVKEKPPIL